jgi:hypothetical protein
MVLGVGNEATFSIVEINKFKMVPHLTLKFRKGNDDAIKKYLAGKYKEATLKIKEAMLIIKELQGTLFNSQDSLEKMSMQN